VLRILITAGATREMLDPVRFLSNLSTGKMGYALAEVARKRGHRVVLISAPTDLKPPSKVKFVSVVNTLQMQSAVKRYFGDVDSLIMTAAVSDYRPQRIAKQKIKKTKTLVLKLRQNPDILFELGKKKADKILVGFSLESRKWLENSREKLLKKNLDFIVANRISKTKNPFGENRISGAILDGDGGVEKFSNTEKEKIAEKVIRKVEKIWSTMEGYSP